MAEPVKIDNFSSSSIIDKSTLAADVLAGASTITLENADEVIENSFALIGLPGSEAAELHGIQSVAGDVLTLTAPLSRDFPAATPVTILQADKYRIYRATNVVGTAPLLDLDYSALDEVDLATDSMQTLYLDPSGGAGYWYKVTQYNSLLDTETALQDSQAARGGSVTDYATLADIRSETGFESADNLPDALISRMRRRAQSYVDTHLAPQYVVPFNPIPGDIREITTLMAAGWVLLKEYGELEDGTNKEGKAKLAEGREWLKIILSNAQSGVSFLPGATRVETADDTDRVSGWPDDSTATADPINGAGGEAAFKIGEVF